MRTSKYTPVEEIKPDDTKAGDSEKPDNPIIPSGNGGTPGDTGGTYNPPVEQKTEQPIETPTETPTEKPTEAPTEELTEEPTEELTEEPTEELTEEPTEELTDIPTEEPTESLEQPTDDNSENHNNDEYSGGGIDQKPSNPNVDPLTPPVEPPVVDNPDVMTDEPTINDYVESEMQIDPVEEYIVDEVAPIEDATQESQKQENNLKTMGIATGIGLAVGASALGAHTIIKSKEGGDTDDDYGYGK